MADDIRTFTVTVAAGTLETAPAITALALPRADLERVDIVVPSGHSGQTGIALALAQQQVIPFEDGTWIQADDESISLPLDDYPESGQWSALAFNDDVFAHSFYLRFLLNRRAALVGVGGDFAPLVF